MADDHSFNNDWENSIIRQALSEVGSEESLRAFDEEQERMKREAEEEIEQMKKDGLLMS